MSPKKVLGVNRLVEVDLTRKRRKLGWGGGREREKKKRRVSEKNGAT